jgi:hypothetical protein
MAKQITKRAKKAAVTVPKLSIKLPLDAEKINAIQRCIKKGNLSITISKVNLAGGKLGDGYLYD